MCRVAVLAFAFVFACEISPDEGVSVSGPGVGDSAQGDDDADSGGGTSSDGPGTAASASAEETASPDGSTDEGTSMATFQPGDGSSSTESSGDSDGAAETMGGAAEDGGAYAPCESGADCFADPGLACLKADENGANGFCSPACGTMGQAPPDPQLCPPAPDGVTATKVCVEGFVRNCALSCAGNLTCPEGTTCLPANGGGGPFCFGV